jgi:hypothetical protein
MFASQAPPFRFPLRLSVVAINIVSRTLQTPPQVESAVTSVKSLLSSGNTSGSAESAEVMVEELEKIRAEAHATCVMVRLPFEQEGNGMTRRRAVIWTAPAGVGTRRPPCPGVDVAADEYRPPIADH